MYFCIVHGIVCCGNWHEELSWGVNSEGGLWGLFCVNKFWKCVNVWHTTMIEVYKKFYVNYEVDVELIGMML